MSMQKPTKSVPFIQISTFLDVYYASAQKEAAISTWGVGRV